MDSVINESKKFKLDRPITGVIQEDRIWEQWYDPEIFKQDLPKMNQTDYLFKCNEGYEEQTIINNRDKKSLTIDEFHKLVDKITASLVVYGISKGDKIATIGLSTPELVAIKYASARIGAITANLNFADGKGGLDHNKLYKQLKMIDPSIVFTLDILENSVSEVLNQPEFREIGKVRLSLVESTNLFNKERVVVPMLKISNQIKNLNIKGSISMRKFEQLSLQHHGIIDSVYEPDLPSNIALTSGTTGDSKGVLLSHDANNALALQHKLANLGLERGKKNLALVPPFLAFWDADIIHMAMCLGVTEVLELALTYKNIPNYLKKYDANYGIWSQYLWDSVLNLSDEEIKMISSKMDKIVVGGERADINQTKRFAEMTGILQEAGYGATEMDSCFSVAHPNCNVLGSAGLPLPFNNVRIVDENFKDLTYNQNGRILLTGPAQMLGYYKRDDLTKKVLITDEKGTVWYNTNDYGHIDITGSIVPIDRLSAPIVIHTNDEEKKIQLIDVTETMKQYPYIKLCKTNSSNGVVVSHIVLDNFSEIDEEAMIDGMLQYFKENLKEYELPNIINIVDELNEVGTVSLPRTSTGKVDYQKLGKISDSLALEYVDNASEKLKIIFNYGKGKIKNEQKMKKYI